MSSCSDRLLSESQRETILLHRLEHDILVRFETFTCIAQLASSVLDCLQHHPLVCPQVFAREDQYRPVPPNRFEDHILVRVAHQLHAHTDQVEIPILYRF
eukprot:CAMPEP_0206514406 /NCGR_PEP_ID=MMETSP0324_2-20121206/62096_1 /ASSEMBLY_ACC=CAM_ASM_000836 /TAXON_ID=2866 /ORGANISM="Crypthecodinium cohnii, Strain Seligo" /LENGTH=99 /DNA_ID=CAMNT_0054006829 /DNA_START=127 /DNA_END=426 /DNA_ORIENTATION=-